MSAEATEQEYRVLARKYRPSDFSSLIGQEAMVRTLSNAIDAGRLAHAFILTGVRGVGKTTTARIIAKALNCEAHDGPTIDPCGKCEACVAIAESRHVDVLEMDAASRTGVDDVREIIESVRYAPVSARFKVYIIDEVHMLSKQAFNALLKTLEEPPAHVKFIFATTEIRKLPVTILSRCQRFDLKRIESETLVAHLAGIVEAEGCKADENALKMIARAAEGSVRDSLSLLDQAIAHAAGDILEDQIRSMLGLADRAQVMDLYEQIMKGDIAAALATLRAQYDRGADPGVVLNDLLEVTHWLTRLKVTPDAGTDSLVSESEKEQGGRMAQGLSMPQLTRAWQMLLKGLGEVRVSPSPISAAEMVLIRLAYAADLPGPAELVKKIQDGGTVGGTPSVGSRGAGGGAPSGPVHMSDGNPAATQSLREPRAGGAQVLALRQDDGANHAKHPLPISFDKMVDLFHTERKPQLAVMLKDRMRLVDYTVGKVTLQPTDETVPADFYNQIRNCLKVWTGKDWLIVRAAKGGGASIREREVAADKQRRDEAMEDPVVKALFDVFPEADLLAVRENLTEKEELALGGDDNHMRLESAEEDTSDFDF